jgi:hypothetical protein
MKRAAFAMGLAIVACAPRAGACDREGLRLITGIAVERVDASATNAKLVAAGYTPLPSAQATLGPLLGFGFTCSRFVFTGELGRISLATSSAGPNGSSATFQRLSFGGLDFGWIAAAHRGAEIGPFAAFEITDSSLRFEAPADPSLPAGMFKSQARLSIPMRLGLRFKKTFDTGSGAFFGYAEPNNQGAGPLVGLELGWMISPGTTWFDDTDPNNPGPDSAVRGLGATGPFVRLILGLELWHAGNGPWSR